MKNNKKIILSLIVILIVVFAMTGIFLIINNNNSNNENDNLNDSSISRLEKIYNKMINDNNYSFKLYLNEENYKNTFKNGTSAKIEINDENEKKTYIIRNSNTYLLVDKTKKYYTYENNVSMLNTLENDFKNLLQKQAIFGKEEIEEKEYLYEEYDKVSSFLINYKGNVNNTKTRFYFEGNDLKYIKTYVGDVEQLLKADLEFNNQTNTYKIPNEYK